MPPSYYVCRAALEGRQLEFDHFASRRDAGKIARHFSAGIMQQYKDESRRDD
jgi:hypothetical protein